MPTTGERFERAVSIMAKLRGPGGCPWDREQTFDTIKPYTLEEAYEVLEAIDNRDWDELRGELGDLLLQVLFYSQMAQEESRFSIDDVLDRLSNKLTHRHPHVFGDVTAETSADVLRNWEALKAEEKKKRLEANGGKSAKPHDPESVLAGVSSTMPALLEAHKLSSRAAHVGFDWPEIGGLFDKLEEEAEELKYELRAPPVSHGTEPALSGQATRGTGGSPVQTERSSDTGWLPSDRADEPPVPHEISGQRRHRLEEEIGDLFFVLVNIARHLSVDPESALKKANRKFKRRFQWMEGQLHNSGRTPQDASMEELEAMWQEAKRFEAETAQ
jgi:nucleoside triphosphate diphosphatase